MVKYTRRHYKDIAELLKQISPKAKRKEAAKKYCKMFEADNERFDEKRFLTACDL